MLFKKLMKPAWSDEELQKLTETRVTVNTVPATGVNKILKNCNSVTRYGPRVTVARVTVRSSPTGNVPPRKTLSRQKLSTSFFWQSDLWNTWYSC